MNVLRVNSVFRSVDGEVNLWGQGHWSLFIRLQECNLRCLYCDTKQAQRARGLFEYLTDAALLDTVIRSGCSKVTITGGEPLLQKDALIPLINSLIEHNIRVSIETNGSIDVHDLPMMSKVGQLYAQKEQGLCIVMDYKLPSSGMEDRMSKARVSQLSTCDFLKFVISDERDYNRARDVLERFNIHATPAFSPCMPGLDAKILFEWMDRDKLYHVLFNIQIHKLIAVK